MQLCPADGAERLRLGDLDGQRRVFHHRQHIGRGRAGSRRRHRGVDHQVSRADVGTHPPQDVRVLRHAAGELLLPAHGQLRPPDPVQHGADTPTTDATVGAMRPLHRVHVASWRTDHRLQAQSQAPLPILRLSQVWHVGVERYTGTDV